MLGTGVRNRHFLRPIGHARAHHVIGRDSHARHITRTVSHHVGRRCLLTHHGSAWRDGLETLASGHHPAGAIAHSGGATGATEPHVSRRSGSHVVMPHLVHHVVHILVLVRHHLIVIRWGWPVLRRHVHMLLLLLLLLLHLHHHLWVHLRPHMMAHHTVVGSHVHLVGSHHAHLLHSLLVHHLHLLLLVHDTIRGHLLAHALIRHHGHVTRHAIHIVSHGALLARRHRHTPWRGRCPSRGHGLTHGVGIAHSVPTLGPYSDI